jgi:predicted transposase YbfD/YdcC
MVLNLHKTEATIEKILQHAELYTELHWEKIASLAKEAIKSRSGTRAVNM